MKKYYLSATSALFLASMGSATAVTIGVIGTGTSLDGWDSNMIIQESYNYTNTSGGTETFNVDSWQFNVSNDRGRVTPFLVRLNNANGNGDIYDDDNFTLLWIGNTLVSDAVTGGGPGSGDYGDVTGTVAFPESGSFSLANGEVVALGFLNSNPDGTGTAELGEDSGSVITYTNNIVPAGQQWYNGNNVADTYPSGTWAGGVDSNITAASSAGVTVRSYDFQINFSQIPEPSSAFLGLLGVLPLLRRRR